MNAHLAHHLDRVLTTVSALLDALAPRRSDRPPSPSPRAAALGAPALDHLISTLAALEEEAAEAMLPLPEGFLARRFGLDPTDLALLWVIAAPHLDPSLDDLIARAHDDVRKPHLDLALLLRAFTTTRTEALELMRRLGGGGVLQRRGLVLPSAGPGTNPLHHHLTPSDHVPPFLAGLDALSPRVARHARRIRPTLDAGDVPLGREVSANLLPLLRGFRSKPEACGILLGEAGLDAPRGVFVALHGPEGCGRQTAAKAVAGTLGAGLVIVDGRLLSFSPPEEQRAVLETVMRAAELTGDLVLIRGGDGLLVAERAVTSALRHELELRDVAVLASFSSPDDVPAELEPLALARVSARMDTTPETQERLWIANLPERSAILDDGVSLNALARRVTLSPVQIHRAHRLAYYNGEAHPEAPQRTVLRDAPLQRAARAQVSTNIGSLATVSEPSIPFGSLILDRATSDRIRELIAAARSRQTILEGWGLGKRIRRGIGLVALFDGDPGTGKTHAAEVIASELGLALVHVNVASVVDKYIGETEKNLERIFRESRPDTSLLLFDEADSLFSKRTSQVEKAADRYSNMDINTMLQLIERYAGMTILTTNLKKAIDPAFERRFAFKIHFELPGPEERRRIWEHFLGADVKVAEDLDFDRIAAVPLTGGEIKNALLRASYEAASRGDMLRTRGLVRAAQSEAAAAGRLVRNSLD